MVTNSANFTGGAVEALTAVLAEEQLHYQRLLDLARRQGRLMTGHDLEGLHDNTRQFNESLAAAQAVRSQREQLARDLMQESGTTEAGSLSAWLYEQPAPLRHALQQPVQAVRRAAAELARTNEMNRRLANFCLDLVEEEAALLRRCLLSDPSGCYDREAQPMLNEQGGTLKRQA
ncbi:MAG: flagellar export chaperone FlgN [Candidatus Krumholzibacteria bacterium]|jgi:polysaccharide pyruvyl transferase WcaK-like protein|nr:flagellar export chaperone FlgN [Candidatus Krumholzibacteria bacterium]